jgi:hypothetical protein
MTDDDYDAMSAEDHTACRADAEADIVAWLRRELARLDRYHPAALGALEMVADAIEAGAHHEPEPHPLLEELTAWLDEGGPGWAAAVVATTTEADDLQRALIRAKAARPAPEAGRLVKRGHRGVAIYAEGEPRLPWPPVFVWEFGASTASAG